MAKQPFPQSEVTAARRKLAEVGIVAIYGGSKGHGFWLAQTTPERALWHLAHPMETINQIGISLRNDGRKSGNEYFFMWDDALALAANPRPLTSADYEQVVIYGANLMGIFDPKLYGAEHQDRLVAAGMRLCNQGKARWELRNSGGVDILFTLE
jgi:hypothetical protein